MILTTRRTYAFIEIKAEEEVTTVFKSNHKEVKEAIENLLDVVSELSTYTDMSFSEIIEQYSLDK